MAEVTVIIPVYNMEHYIKSSVMSVIDQEGFPVGDIEILVVNDGSTDNTKHIIQELIEGHNGLIKLIDLKDNIGVMGAAIEGLKRASGRYICLLDADDIWHPAKISEVTVFLEKGYDLVLHEGEYIDADGKGTGIPIECLLDDDCDIPEYIRSFNGGTPLGSNICLKSEKLDLDLLASVYDQFMEKRIDRLVSHDTSILHTLLSNKNIKAKCVRKNLYKYRIHENNITLVGDLLNPEMMIKFLNRLFYCHTFGVEIYKKSGLYYKDPVIESGYRKFMFYKDSYFKEKNVYALLREYMFLLNNKGFINNKEKLKGLVDIFLNRFPHRLQIFVKKNFRRLPDI